jgi:DNA-binding transcriptional MerR regulator
LGYPADIAEAENRDAQLKTKMTGLLEQAYAGFIKEVLFWQKQGYTLEEISEFLVRIYKEQIAGSHQVAIDRKQRRERMKTTLSRMQKDTAVSPDLLRLAETTAAKLEKIS